MFLWKETTVCTADREICLWHKSRSKEKDPSTAAMDVVQKAPRALLKLVGAVARWLDRHGWMPKSVIATDPYYASAVLTNLGSIQLHSGYHHLTNWGTNSVFCAIGERKKRPFFDDEGNVEMRDSVDLGLTIDERIADGYYYSKTVSSCESSWKTRSCWNCP